MAVNKQLIRFVFALMIMIGDFGEKLFSYTRKIFLKYLKTLLNGMHLMQAV